MVITFETYCKRYIALRKLDGFSLEIPHAFKVMLADYDLFIQNEENVFIPHCLIGKYYEPNFTFKSI